MSKLSDKQRAWLKKLGTVVNSGDGGGAEVAAPAEPHLITVSATATRKTPPTGPGANKIVTAAGDGAKAVASSGRQTESKEGIAPAAVLPIIIPIIIAKAKITCKCQIINDTNQTLEFDVFSLDNPNGNGFEKAPPLKISPGGKDDFVVVNKAPFLVGVEGQVEYTIDGETHAFFRWERSRDQDIPLVGSNSAAFAEFRDNKHNKADSAIYKVRALPDNPQADSFIFQISGKGPVPKPGPEPPGPGPQPPGPQPAQDIRTSCNITVTNNTKLVLTLADQGHDRGDFMTFPPTTIQPGASAQFVSVETPHGKEQGCKGFVSWEVGSPSAAIWRCEWDNPEGDQNHAKAPAEPQSAGFRTVAQIGQDDENVPVVFTISGGGAGPAPQPGPSPQPQPGPQPGPAPGPAPEPEPAFLAPPGSRQPTLRKGDKKADGWVEYLQHLLNDHFGAGTVDVDGSFGAKTLAAVTKFQQQNKLQVDGTVGNQTWAALRGEKPEAPSSDGRTPHTFEQKDLQARWEVEDTPDATYVVSADRLTINVVSVGEGKIDDFFATVRITPPDSPAKVVKVKIGAPFERTANDQGNRHAVALEKFKKTFPAKDPNAKIEDYLVEGFFDKELGPDLFKGHITVQK